MPSSSKWQSLPTEAINPVSLAVDKAAVLDIVDMVVNEDRKVIAETIDHHVGPQSSTPQQ